MKARYTHTQRSIETLAGRKASRRAVLKWAAGATGALAATPLLAACGDDDGGSTGSNELVIVTGLDPGAPDPHGTNAAVSEATSVFGQMFETLIDVEYGEDLTPEIVAQLATEWSNVDDLTWEFKLRDGVKWHNGDDFVADDVKFSVERILDPELSSPATQYIPPSLDRVEVVDPKTVRFITTTPFPLMLINVSRVRIVPKNYVEAQGTEGFRQNPVGTGPFKFVEYVTDDHTTVEKNPDYWGEEPQIDRVIFRPKPEASTRTAELKAGTADIITLVPISDVQGIEDSEDLAIAEVPSNRAMFVMLDSIDESIPLADVKVRQALNYAVNKDELVNIVLQGHATKLDGQLVPKQFFGYNEDLEPIPYDPDKAKALLAEAGYADGFEIVFRGPVGRYMADKELTEAIAGQLADVGIRATLDIREWSVYIGDLYNRGLAPMFFLGWGPVPDAMGMFTLHECESIVKYHCNPEYDQMVAEAKQTLDESRRIELYDQITQWLNDNPPVIYLHQQHNIYGRNTSVKGFQPSPDEVIRLKGVTKE